MNRNTYARWYRDWTLAGALACLIAGFPQTPLGPLLLWAVILPGAAWLLLRPRRQPDSSAPADMLPCLRRRRMAQPRRRRPLPGLREAA